MVARPIGAFSSHTDYNYQTLRCNVDLLRIIQLGITFADENGDIPDDCPTWQFNFKFNLKYVWVCRAVEEGGLHRAREQGECGARVHAATAD